MQYDPFATLPNKQGLRDAPSPSQSQPAYDPFASLPSKEGVLEAPLTAEIVDERRNSNPWYEVSPAEAAVHLQARDAKSLLEFWKEAGGEVWSGVKEVPKQFADAWKELQEDDRKMREQAAKLKAEGKPWFRETVVPRYGRIAGTLAEAGAQAVAGIAKPVFDISSLAAFKAGRQFTDNEARIVEAYRRYLNDKQIRRRTVEGLPDKKPADYVPGQIGPIIQPLKGSAFEPYQKTAIPLSYLADPSLLAGAAAGMAKAGGRSIGRAALRDTAGAVERVAGRVSEVVDKPLKAINALPDELRAVREPLRALESVTSGALRVPATAVGKVAEATRRLAEMGPSQVPRLVRLADDATAPKWLRNTARVVHSYGLGGAAQFAGDLATSAAHGAAVGGILSLGADDPREVGHAIGTGGALGVGGRLVTKALGMDRMSRHLRGMQGDLAALYAHLIEQGLDPEVIKTKIKDPEALTLAATWRAAVDKGVTFRFLEGPQYAAEVPTGPNTGAAFAPDSRTIRVNLDAPSTTDLSHELGHALLKARGVEGEVRLMIDSIFGPEKMKEIARRYARGLVQNEVEGSPSKPASEATWKAMTERKIQELNEQWKGDSWLYAEIYADVGRMLFRGDLYGDLIAPSFFRRIARGALGEHSRNSAAEFLKERGALFDPEVYGKDLQLMLERHLQEIASSGRGAKAAKETREGAPQGMPVPDELLGKHPSVPPDSDAVTVEGSTVRPATPREVRQKEKARQTAVKDTVLTRPAKPKGDTSAEVAPRVDATGVQEVSGTEISTTLDSLPQFSKEAVKIAKFVEGLIGANEGGVLRVWYQAIGTGARRFWKKDVRGRLGNVAVAQVELAPYDFNVSKEGNVLVRGISVTALRRKLAEWQNSGKLALWNGDAEAFLRDLDAYLKSHARGEPGATNLEAPALAPRDIREKKRDLLNVFVIGKNAKHADLNPLRAGLSGPDAKGIIRSLRIDRMANPEPGEGAYPAAYPLKVQNFTYAGPKAAGFEGAAERGETFTGRYDKKERFEVSDSGMRALHPSRTGWQNIWQGKSATLGSLVKHPALFTEYPDLRNIPVRTEPLRTPLTPMRGYWDGLGGEIVLDKGLVDMFIAAGDSPSRHAVEQIILHEIQHGIQERENFAKGSSVETERRKLETAYNQARIAADVYLNPDPNDATGTRERAEQKLRAMLEVLGLEFEPQVIENILRKPKPSEVLMRSQAQLNYLRQAGEIEARDTEARRNLTPEQRKTVPPYSSENVPESQARVQFSPARSATEKAPLDELRRRRDEALENYRQATQGQFTSSQSAQKKFLGLPGQQPLPDFPLTEERQRGKPETPEQRYPEVASAYEVYRRAHGAYLEAAKGHAKAKAGKRAERAKKDFEAALDEIARVRREAESTHGPHATTWPPEVVAKLIEVRRQIDAASARWLNLDPSPQTALSIASNLSADAEMRLQDFRRSRNLTYGGSPLSWPEQERGVYVQLLKAHNEALMDFYKAHENAYPQTGRYRTQPELVGGDIRWRVVDMNNLRQPAAFKASEPVMVGVFDDRASATAAASRFNESGVPEFRPPPRFDAVEVRPHVWSVRDTRTGEVGKATFNEQTTRDMVAELNRNTGPVSERERPAVAFTEAPAEGVKISQRSQHLTTEQRLAAMKQHKQEMAAGERANVEERQRATEREAARAAHIKELSDRAQQAFLEYQEALKAQKAQPSAPPPGVTQRERSPTTGGFGIGPERPAPIEGRAPEARYPQLAEAYQAYRRAAQAVRQAQGKKPKEQKPTQPLWEWDDKGNIEVVNDESIPPDHEAGALTLAKFWHELAHDNDDLARYPMSDATDPDSIASDLSIPGEKIRVTEDYKDPEPETLGFGDESDGSYVDPDDDYIRDMAENYKEEAEDAVSEDDAREQLERTLRKPRQFEQLMEQARESVKEGDLHGEQRFRFFDPEGRPRRRRQAIREYESAVKARAEELVAERVEEGMQDTLDEMRDEKAENLAREAYDEDPEKTWEASDHDYQIHYTGGEYYVSGPARRTGSNRGRNDLGSHRSFYDAVSVAEEDARDRGYISYGDEEKEGITFYNDRGASITIHDPNGSPYINAQDSEQGAGGAQLYKAAFLWAHNNGETIRTGGLTSVNSRRRTSNMLSLAILLGKTDFSHADPAQGVRLSYGDHWGNIEKLALKEAEYAHREVPELSKLHFDFRRGKFVDDTGRPVTPAALKDLIGSWTRSAHARNRDAATGLATAKRAILTRSFQEALGRPGMGARVAGLVRAVGRGDRTVKETFGGPMLYSPASKPKTAPAAPQKKPKARRRFLPGLTSKKELDEKQAGK